MRYLTVLAGLALMAADQGPKGASPPAKSKLVAPGQLQQASGPLAQVFPFTFDGPKLKLNRPQPSPSVVEDPKLKLVRPAAPVASSAPVEMLFRQIHMAAGITGSSVTASGADRVLTFSGQNLSGRLETRANGLRITLEETRMPQRTLEFQESAPGFLRIQVSNLDGDLVLLQQARNGACTMVAVNAGQVTTAHGDSFVAILRRHRKDMESLVFPVLEQFGIQPILSLHTPRVRQAVLAQVLRTPEALADGQKLLAQLDSEKFDLREAATRRLSERFDNFKDLIETRLGDKSISLESHMRLQKIVAQHADAARVTQTVAALDLTRDADYLVSLLDHVRPEEAPLLIRHLEKTTGQNLGDDPAAWKKWAKETPK